MVRALLFPYLVVVIFESPEYLYILEEMTRNKCVVEEKGVKKNLNARFHQYIL